MVWWTFAWADFSRFFFSRESLCAWHSLHSFDCLAWRCRPFFSRDSWSTTSSGYSSHHTFLVQTWWSRSRRVQPKTPSGWWPASWTSVGSCESRQSSTCQGNSSSRACTTQVTFRCWGSVTLWCQGYCCASCCAMSRTRSCRTRWLPRRVSRHQKACWARKSHIFIVPY